MTTTNPEPKSSFQLRCVESIKRDTKVFEEKIKQDTKVFEEKIKQNLSKLWYDEHYSLVFISVGISIFSLLLQLFIKASGSEYGFFSYLFVNSCNLGFSLMIYLYDLRLDTIERKNSVLPLENTFAPVLIVIGAIVMCGIMNFHKMAYVTNMGMLIFIVLHSSDLYKWIQSRQLN